jgi:hypothetical protein
MSGLRLATMLLGAVVISASGARGGEGVQGGTGGAQPMPPGCAKVVAVLDEGGGGLSADEVAKKSNTDVETVRSCTDLWRNSMKGGAKK